MTKNYLLSAKNCIESGLTIELIDPLANSVALRFEVQFLPTPRHDQLSVVGAKSESSQRLPLKHEYSQRHPPAVESMNRNHPVLPSSV